MVLSHLTWILFSFLTVRSHRRDETRLLHWVSVHINCQVLIRTWPCFQYNHYDVQLIFRFSVFNWPVFDPLNADLLVNLLLFPIFLCRSTIGNEIIPRAVLWYLGEAVQGDKDENMDEVSEDEESEDVNNEVEEG